MLTPPASLMIYVATQPVDFRKGAEGLALLAKETLGQDPMKGVAVVFRAKRADRVKIVVWDGSGLVMYWKRLDARASNLAAESACVGHKIFAASGREAWQTRANE